MDFLIQTALYSIELHGHAMAFHVTASVLQGTPWHSMELHHYFMELRGTPWHSLELRGIPWIFMNSMEVFHARWQ